MASSNHIKEALDAFTRTEFTFTDRDSYIVWRAEWRERYERLSKLIRQMKNDTSNSQRSLAEQASLNQMRLAFQRSLAFRYMEQRMAAKALCKTQREANSWDHPEVAVG